MIFRYDFYKNTDLNKFKKQVTHYVKTFDEISYHIFLEKYKLIFDVDKDNENKSLVKLNIFDLSRDNSGDITIAKQILPMNDKRFLNLKEINLAFEENSFDGKFEFYETNQLAEKMAIIIKILSKIDTFMLYI